MKRNEIIEKKNRQLLPRMEKKTAEKSNFFWGERQIGKIERRGYFIFWIIVKKKTIYNKIFQLLKMTFVPITTEPHSKKKKKVRTIS